jgi:hypothetical protein
MNCEGQKEKNHESGSGSWQQVNPTEESRVSDGNETFDAHAQ